MVLGAGEQGVPDCCATHLYFILCVCVFCSDGLAVFCFADDWLDFFVCPHRRGHQFSTLASKMDRVVLAYDIQMVRLGEPMISTDLKL